MSLDIGASHVWPRTSARLRSAPSEGRGERASGCRRSDPNVLLLGSPGVGTSRLARRLTPILPALCLAEAIDTTRLQRVADPHRRPYGMGHDAALPGPPHHTSSDVGLIGGGQVPQPGEVSLAHHGVRLLDELPEFRRHVLEVLRQPLEDGVVTITGVPMFASAVTLRPHLHTPGCKSAMLSAGS
jgi:DNA replicative helicase MCM subunit Mcm2 (Cdc46/Mcm family)